MIRQCLELQRTGSWRFLKSYCHSTDIHLCLDRLVAAFNMLRSLKECPKSLHLKSVSLLRTPLVIAYSGTAQVTGGFSADRETSIERFPLYCEIWREPFRLRPLGIFHPGMDEIRKDEKFFCCFYLSPLAALQKCSISQETYTLNGDL